jgi:hypothetical protein
MRYLLLLSLLLTFGWAKSVTASFTYTLGDRDTKIEAKKIAFAEAKRIAIEKIGVWINSETNIVNGQIANDQIQSYIMGYAKTKILSENFTYPKYTITIELEIDEADLKKHLPATKQTTEEPVQEALKPAPEPTDESVSEKEPTGSLQQGDTLEIGVLFGSGSLKITQTDKTTSDESDESYGTGFGGIKLCYLFTPHHAVEIISGGGNTKVDGDDLQVNTTGVGYLYHFGQVSTEPIFPFAGIGLVSGQAVLSTDSGDTTYKGTGAMIHLGAKWFFRHDSHHVADLGLLVQSFKDESFDSTSNLKSIQFERSHLTIGYSYRF